jgi:hypothetical protein
MHKHNSGKSLNVGRYGTSHPLTHRRSPGLDFAIVGTFGQLQSNYSSIKIDHSF